MQKKCIYIYIHRFWHRLNSLSQEYRTWSGSRDQDCLQSFSWFHEGMPRHRCLVNRQQDAVGTCHTCHHQVHGPAKMTEQLHQLQITHSSRSHLGFSALHVCHQSFLGEHGRTSTARLQEGWKEKNGLQALLVTWILLAKLCVCLCACVFFLGLKAFWFGSIWFSIKFSFPQAQAPPELEVVFSHLREMWVLSHQVIRINFEFFDLKCVEHFWENENQSYEWYVEHCTGLPINVPDTWSSPSQGRSTVGIGSFLPFKQTDQTGCPVPFSDLKFANRRLQSSFWHVIEHFTGTKTQS